MLCLVSLISLSTAPAHAETALQKHVAFFDRNNDGMITWSETYEGSVALGFGWKSGAMATLINGGLGNATGGSTFTVNVTNIHQGKHDNDTDAYDAEGNFSQVDYDRIFERYDYNRDNAISNNEFRALYAGRYETWSGSIVSQAEFGFLQDIAGITRKVNPSCWWWCDTETVISRSTLASFYDGSLFYVIAGESVPN